MKEVSENRTRLLLELESIIGRECYNASIQNWGPNGVFEGEGRDFRYPITFIEPSGNKIKRKFVYDLLSPQVAITGHYAFGANQLQIIRALDKVVRHLEEKHNLSI